MATDVGRKLCLTAAFAGAYTRKDLAAVFRRVNPHTCFDVERAHKWLQDRAQPRERRIYEDWARLVDLDEPAEWITDCPADLFLERLCARHALDKEVLLRRADAFGGIARSREVESGMTDLPGTYACYSHAWSPYFPGRLIRGALSITAKPGPQRLMASYAEALPTGPIHLDGPVNLSARGVHLDLRAAKGSVQMLFCLFPPTPPMSVLGGFMTGMALLGSEPQPSMSRTIMIRLPASSRHLETADAYLPPEASLAADLADMGANITAPEMVDQMLRDFLNGGQGTGIDQISAASFRVIVELFDRQWLQRKLPSSVMGASSSV